MVVKLILMKVYNTCFMSLILVNRPGFEMEYSSRQTIEIMVIHTEFNTVRKSLGRNISRMVNYSRV